MSLKECPEPAARTLNPRRLAPAIAAESSSIELGRSIDAGRQN
jgi:hypothetical protein